VFKVILYLAALQPHMEVSVVFTRWPQSATPSNTWLLGPMRVHNPNGISISSVVFVGLTTVTDQSTHRQTDRQTTLLSL